MPLGVLGNVFAEFIPVLKISLLLLGWPGVDHLFPRFGMRFFARHRLSIVLDGMMLNWSQALTGSYATVVLVHFRLIEVCKYGIEAFTFSSFTLGYSAFFGSCRSCAAY